MKRFWIATLSAALVLAGCGESETEPAREQATAPGTETTAAAAADTETNAFLGNIDAETAYVYANLERLPEAVSDKVWEMNDISATSNRAMFEALSEDEEIPPEARALVDEITGLTTREGWEGAGLHANPFYAFYAVQLMPFAEIELSDGAAFSEFIANIEGNLDQPFTRRNIGGTDIIWIEIQPGLGFAIRHDDDSVTAALIPDDAALLARVAGEYEPVEAMSAGALAGFNDDAGFGSHGSGYVDWKRFIDGMLAEDAPLAALYQEESLGELRRNPACVAEYGALTEAMPRMVFGYTRMTVEEMDFMLRQELAPDLAKALKPMAQAPVSIDRELQGLFNLGLAIDLVAGREFARSLVDGWVENPPQCPSFRTIAAQAPEMQENLARPIPPVVTNMHGLYLEAMTFDLGEGGIPTGGGTLSFFMENPQLLVGMAQMFSPAVAELELEPGGEPKRIPEGAVPQLAQLDLQAWIAMAESAIGVAIGEEHVDRLTDAIRSTEADDLLLAGRMDFELLTQMMDLAESAIADVETDGAAEGLAAQRAQYERLAEMYEEAAFKMRLGDRGIEFIGETTLK